MLLRLLVAAPVCLGCQDSKWLHADFSHLSSLMVQSIDSILTLLSEHLNAIFDCTYYILDTCSLWAFLSGTILPSRRINETSHASIS